MSASFAHLRTISSEAIAAGVVPGMAVAVGQAGQTPLIAAFGHRQLEPQPLAALEDTLWDLASLTKALCTSVLCMQAVQRSELSLDEPLDPGLPLPTVRQVLAHAGGFSAHLQLYREVLAPGGEGAGSPAARASMLGRIRQATRLYQPGTRSIYSDLGFILLGDLLERRLGADLATLFRQRIGAPVGLTDDQLGFRPIPQAGVDRAPPPGPAGIAATQRCPLRGRVLVGEVDDLNVFALGGVAGHAGLFGTAAAVATLLHALCAAYRGAGLAGGAPLVDRQVLRTFWSPAGVPGSTWRLGWDGPAATGSLAGDRISRAAVGHLAFTGCSVWVDPERDIFVVMLSNRVHPELRQDPRFNALRRAVNDAALGDLGYLSQPGG